MKIFMALSFSILPFNQQIKASSFITNYDFVCEIVSELYVIWNLSNIYFYKQYIERQLHFSWGLRMSLIDDPWSSHCNNEPIMMKRHLTIRTYGLPAKIMHGEIIDVQSCRDKWIEIWHHRSSQVHHHPPSIHVDHLP